MMTIEYNRLLEWEHIHLFIHWKNMQNRIEETSKNKNLNIIIKTNEVTGRNTQEHKLHWQRIPDHPYSILAIDGSGQGKTNALLNLIIHQPGIDKIYLYAKDQYEPKYQLLITK